MSTSRLPFDRYQHGGRSPLGRPRQGDVTARHGYGPPVFAECGFACVYCGFDMSKPYENWLQLSVDHVVPSGARSHGYLPEWLEDITNLVTCCRPCNEFSNAFVVGEPPPSDWNGFYDVRDRAFHDKQALVTVKHHRERQWYEDNVVRRHAPTGPDLVADPTP